MKTVDVRTGGGCMTTTLTPPLKWAGSKRWLAPKLAELYQPYRNTHRWVEPFVGGMGATLGVMPEAALLSDYNHWVVFFYLAIAKKLIYPAAIRINSEENYYRMRDHFNWFVDNPEGLKFFEVLGSQVDTFYYLNRTCYNGLCRFNRKGQFNTPYGKYKKINYREDFNEYQPVFSKWRFMTGDWRKCLERVTENDFIYADPPYHGTFTGYSGNVFGLKEQGELAKALSELKCPVVASNAATAEMIALYQDLGFEVQLVSAPRSISCKGDRKAVMEVLATRNLEVGK